MTVIRIQEYVDESEGSKAVLSFDSADEFPITLVDPFSPQEEQRLEWYYEEHLRFPFVEEVKFRQAAASVAEYGERLFAQVFAAPQAYARYVSVRQAGLDQARIEIVGSPDFHRYHWEALRDPELKRPLVLEATLVRRTPVPQILPAMPQQSPTLNLLVVTARPGLDRDVSYRTISRPLVETLNNTQVPAQIDIVRPGSYRALKQHLEDILEQYGSGYYHVIHFDMHGALLTYDNLKRGGEANRLVFRSRYGRGEIEPFDGEKAFLFFLDDAPDTAEDRSDPVEAGELADLLKMHQIPVAILNACQSGKQVGASETSLGSRLIQAGMQMVLAMSYSVTVTAATLMMKTLYTRLFEGSDLAVATRRARQELHADKGRRAYFGQQIDLEDWLLPVVYQNRPLSLTLRAFTQEEQKAYYESRAARYSQEPSFHRPHYGFFGRDLDILHIETRLLTRRNLLMVRGMGGAGKTTLLHHLGEWWQTTHLVDRVCYFSYDAQAWTLPQILHAIATRLFTEYEYDTTFMPLSEEGKEQRIIEVLCSWRHLLILDNLESITGNPMAIQNTLPEAEQRRLRRFLAALAGGKSLVLLGSRSGEEWLASGTFGDNLYELGGLDPEAASQLAETLLERQRTTKYRQDPDFRRLLTLLAGYPLALEVVLSNLTRQTPKEVVAALTAGDVALDRGDSQEKTESILRCIDYSHSNLSQEAQDLLLCLAPFTSVIYSPLLPAYSKQLQAQPVLAGLPYDRWPEVLKEATEWGLLTTLPTVPGYLQLQPTFPFFLHSRLNTLGQQQTKQSIENAFQKHYDEFAGFIDQQMNSTEAQAKQLGRILAQLEYENLTTALDLSLKMQVSILEPYRALSDYLDTTHDEVRGLQLGKGVLARLETYPSERLSGPMELDLVVVLDTVGKRQLSLKRYAEAEISYQKALNTLLAMHSHSADDRRRMSASIYNQLGIIARDQRQWDQAEQYIKLALQICIEFNDRHEQASAYYQLGRIAEEQGHWDQAEKYYQQSLQMFIASGDRYAQAGTYHELGVVAQHMRRLEQSEQYYNQALSIKSEFNDRYGQASTYHQLGRVAQEQHQWKLAEQYYQQALRICIEFKDRPAQARIYHQLGTLAAEQHQLEQAEQYYQQAMQIKIEFSDRYSQANTYFGLGAVAQEQHQWEQTEQYYKQALQIYMDFHDANNAMRVRKMLTRTQALVAFHEGNSFVEEGAWKRGLERLRQALDLFREAEDNDGKAAALLAIGDVHLRFGDYEIARISFADAERLFRLMHNEAGEALAQLKIGTAELHLQHVAEAAKYLQAASDYFHHHDAPERASVSDQLLELAKRLSTAPV